MMLLVTVVAAFTLTVILYVDLSTFAILVVIMVAVITYFAVSLPVCYASDILASTQLQIFLFLENHVGVNNGKGIGHYVMFCIVLLHQNPLCHSVKNQ